MSDSFVQFRGDLLMQGQQYRQNARYGHGTRDALGRLERRLDGSLGCISSPTSSRGRTLRRKMKHVLTHQDRRASERETMGIIHDVMAPEPPMTDQDWSLVEKHEQDWEASQRYPWVKEFWTQDVEWSLPDRSIEGVTLNGVEL